MSQEAAKHFGWPCKKLAEVNPQESQALDLLKIYPRSPTPLETRVIEAFRRHIRAVRGSLFTFLRIPEEKLAGAKSTYLKIRHDELLLAIYDATLLSTAQAGTTLTTKRLYWKNGPSSDPKEIEYADIPGPLSWEYEALELGNGLKIFFEETLNKTSVLEFLREAARIYGNRLTIANEAEEVVEDLDQLLEPHLSQLNNLVGLGRVKTQVAHLIELGRVARLRKTQDLTPPDIPLRLVFSGSPGTEKITVARIIGKIYKALGVLEKGHCIEANLASLARGSSTQAARKMKEVVKKTPGGVLFIDEVYMLKSEDSLQRYEQEAVEALLDFIEDHQDNLLVIVSGYTEEIERFVNSNSRLQSGFNEFLYFDDYMPDELLEVFRRLAVDKDYHPTKEAESKLHEILKETYDKKDRSFGNARLVRNLFEKTIKNQASRVIRLSRQDR